MLISMLAVGFTTTSAATVESASTGYSKIESADDFSWDNSNVYFLLTDRFANGDTSNDHSYGRALDANGNPLSGWQSAPGTFHGGDFKGLTQKINEGYFDNLGVNAIWLSAPYEQIHGYVDSGDGHFAHYSYHGYYVLDYTETDRNFGTKAEFKTLVDTAHAHGIRIVMDIVMNHAGYNNIVDMETYNYGTITDKSAIDAYKYKLNDVEGFHNYIDYSSSSSDWGTWWGDSWVRSGLPGYHGGDGGDDLHRCLAGLPDFRTESTASVSIPTFLQTKWQKEGTLSAKQSKYSNCTTVSDYLTTWLAEWVETYGVDGFRCDTAKHVELASWKKLKTKCVTALQNWRRNNPTAVGADWDEDFWMTGECWDYGSGKSEYHTVGGFDSMINFSFSGRSLDGPSSINNVYQDYADRINSDPNFNVLTYNSSHDSNLARGDLYWQGTSLMLLPGGVQPFYGDETNRPTVPGMSFDGHGGSGHSLRSDMNWNSIDTDVLAHWQKVGKFRNNHVAVGAGDHRLISAYNASTGYTFARTYDDGDVSDAVVCCIGAPANQNITVNLGSTFASGKTVTNEYDGSTAVVTNGCATFNSGPQGVILISGPQSTINMSLKSEKRAFYDSMTVTVSLRGADYAMVSIAGGTPFRVVDGQAFVIGEGIEVGAGFDVTMTATNAVETSEMTFSYKKKDPNAITHVYFDNTQYNWSNVNIYVYKGDGDSAVSIKAWPGEAMEFDSTTGLYVYEVDEDFANEGAVVFNAGSGQAQYPAEGVRFDIEGTDKILINKTTWKVYEGETVETPEPPDPATMRTVYFDNSSANYTTPCIHVWKSGSNDPYKPWPGITMTKGEGNLYYASFPATYDMCVFSDNKANQTGDITMPSYQNALYSNGSWSEVQEPTAPTEPQTQYTEPQTQQTQPQTQATQPQTQATQPQTQQTQPQTQATQPQTQATQPQTQATQPQTQATQPQTQATQPTQTQATQQPTQAPATTIKVTAAKKTIYVNASTIVKATVTNGVGTTTFKSSNTKVATVTASGKVVGKKAGSVTITAKNNGKTASVKIKVVKRTNPMTVKAKTVKANANKKTVIKKTKAFTIKKAKGKVTFKKVKGDKKITINKKTGKITVKKGLKKGKTYKFKVKVTAKGNTVYKAKSKTVTVKIKVK